MMFRLTRRRDGGKTVFAQRRRGAEVLRLAEGIRLHSTRRSPLRGRIKAASPPASISLRLCASARNPVLRAFAASRAALKFAAAATLLALAGCKGAEAEAVKPALWEVAGPQGEKGWLFGTVHALPKAVQWRSRAMNAALAGADRLVLEIADSQGVPAMFTRLARTPGQPPLAERIPPALHDKLARVMAEHKLTDAQFAGVETWAAALMLSQAAQGDASIDNGLETALRRALPDRPVEEVEGAAAQLGMFDALAEQDQRDLLAAVVEEAARPAQKRDPLYEAWTTGDLRALEREASTGMLADPELHEALLAGRNRAWAPKVAAMLRAGRHPLVAVGAAHMVGADGLPALLAAQGFTVRRLQ